jgi:hypothetical protein
MRSLSSVSAPSSGPASRAERRDPPPPPPPPAASRRSRRSPEPALPAVSAICDGHPPSAALGGNALEAYRPSPFAPRDVHPYRLYWLLQSERVDREEICDSRPRPLGAVAACRVAATPRSCARRSKGSVTCPWIAPRARRGAPSLKGGVWQRGGDRTSYNAMLALSRQRDVACWIAMSRGRPLYS